MHTVEQLSSGWRILSTQRSNESEATQEIQQNVSFLAVTDPMMALKGISCSESSPHSYSQRASFQYSSEAFHSNVAALFQSGKASAGLPGSVEWKLGGPVTLLDMLTKPRKVPSLTLMAVFERPLDSLAFDAAVITSSTSLKWISRDSAKPGGSSYQSSV